MAENFFGNVTSVAEARVLGDTCRSPQVQQWAGEVGRAGLQDAPAEEEAAALWRRNSESLRQCEAAMKFMALAGYADEADLARVQALKKVGERLRSEIRSSAELWRLAKPEASRLLIAECEAIWNGFADNDDLSGLAQYLDKEGSFTLKMLMGNLLALIASRTEEESAGLYASLKTMFDAELFDGRFLKELVLELTDEQLETLLSVFKFVQESCRFDAGTLTLKLKS